MAHTLSVDRLRTTYLVPRDHPAPDHVRRELDEVARKHVIDCWSRALAGRFNPQDVSVWLIEKVTAELLMDFSAATPDVAAAFWGETMAKSVAAVIAGGEDGALVFRFANRAEYLAGFLRDLASGNAWNKWYYRQFESLRSLPTGAAVREVLLREPEIAEDVLLHLVTTKRFRSVSVSLSAYDRDRLLRLCSPEENTPALNCFEAVLDAWAMASRHPVPVLDLYLSLRLEQPNLPKGELRGAISIVLAIARWNQNSSLDQILSSATSHRFSHCLTGLSEPEQGAALYLASLVSRNPASASRIVEAVCTRVPTPDHVARSSGKSASFASPFGGVFLLLPTLMACPELMAIYGGADTTALRFLLLAASVRANALEMQNDPSLELASGLGSVPELFELFTVERATTKMSLELNQFDLLPEDLTAIDRLAANSWPGMALDPSLRKELWAAATVLLRTFARQLPGLGRCGFEYVWRNILAGGSVITPSPGRILVTFSARPLNIVLSMAGLLEMQFTPPWMPSTEVAVHFERQ